MFTMKHTQFDSVFLMTEEMEDWMEDDDDDLLKYVSKCNILNLTQFDSNLVCYIFRNIFIVLSWRKWDGGCG